MNLNKYNTKWAQIILVLLFSAPLPTLADNTWYHTAPKKVGGGKKKSIFTYILGKPVPSSFFYDPIGSHTGLSSSQPKLKWFQLAGFVFRSFFAMTFINSFGDRTYAIGAQRYIYENHNLAIAYGIGIMYGYNGRLAAVKNMPFSDTFLLEGDINPVLGIITDYKIHHHWRINCVITPLVVTFGFRYVF